MRAFLATLIAMLAGCGQDIGFFDDDPPLPAQPPGDEDEGNPPDWQNCFQGWRGVYSNLTIDHPHVTPRPADEPPSTDPTQLDWWDREAFEKFDPTLDFGGNWWPVDEGLEGDPAYFGVYWHAWIRAWSNTTLEFSLGSSDDAWVIVDGEAIADNPGIQDFERQTYSVQLSDGQYPIEVYYAHRASEESGFSFRVVSGDVSICYPDFGTSTQ
ncbi:MAG: hypothetical protein KTR31_30540 [Myxococcales bacterium]|nr:hypothetical protein [Myxococcales bacterium]